MNKKIWPVLFIMVLIVSFGLAGCSSDDTKTTTAVVNDDVKTAYTTTVKGIVMDDAGNLMEDATVSIGDQTTTTGVDGQYLFRKVPITSYITIVNGIAVPQAASNNNARPVTISIQPPAEGDFANCTAGVVEVTTQMVHIENYGQGNIDENGDLNVLPNSQSFTVLTEVGRCVLPHKSASIEGYVRLEDTGEPVKNTVISIRFTSLLASLTSPTVTYYSDITLASPLIIATTDANGHFSMSGVLTSSIYGFDIQGFNITGGDGLIPIQEAQQNPDPDCPGCSVHKGITVAPYSGSLYVVNAGIIYVSPIATADAIRPEVVTTCHDDVFPFLGIDNPYFTSGRYVMAVYASGIDGTAGKELKVFFTEPIAGPITNPEAVKIYSRTSQEILAIATNGLVLSADGKTLSITLAAALPSLEVLDIRLLRSEFSDLSGNRLMSGDEDDCWETFSEDEFGNRATVYCTLQASTYFDPASNLPLVANLVQLPGDNIDLVTDGYDNDAFNSVFPFIYTASPAWMYNMNAANAAFEDLEYLAEALSTLDVEIDGNVAKIQFDPNPLAAGYYGRVVDEFGVALVTGTLLDRSMTTLPAGPAGGWFQLAQGENYFYVNLGRGLIAGDAVQVAAYNYFNDMGLASSLLLKDNTAPTTVVNEDYPSFGGTYPEVNIMMLASPDSTTGNLVDLLEQGTGFPIIYARADMWAERAGSDEFSLPSGPDDTYSAADFAAYDWSRMIGIQVSEPIVNSPFDIIEAYTDYSALTPMRDDFITAAAYITLDAPGRLYAIAVSVDNILDLQDVDVITLVGMLDAAGNASMIAADPNYGGSGTKVIDVMPPLMVTGSVGGSKGDHVDFAFNEPISLVDADGDGLDGYGFPAAWYITINPMFSPTLRYMFATTDDGKVYVLADEDYSDPKHEAPVAYAGDWLEMEPVVGAAANEFKYKLTGKDEFGVTIAPESWSGSGLYPAADFSNFFAGVYAGKTNIILDSSVYDVDGANKVMFREVRDTSLNPAVGDFNSWTNSRDDLANFIPPFGFQAVDLVSPAILAGYNGNYGFAVNPNAADELVRFYYISDGSGNAINTGSWWDVGDDPLIDGVENYVCIVFTEPVIFTESNITVTPSSTYDSDSIDIYDRSPDLRAYWIYFENDDDVVDEGDTLRITGVADTSGNTVDVVIILDDAGDGIAVGTGESILTW